MRPSTPKPLTTSLLLVVAGLLVGCGEEGRVKPGALASGKVGTRKVAVAAAADLKFALDDLIAQFERRHPAVEVEATYGSSGNLFAQLSREAPFDLFFSADVDYPRMLIAKGLADAESEFLYAEGHLVAWVPIASPIDLETLGIRAMTGPSVQKVAIANPRHAPYGRAAEAALKSLGVYETVKDRLVLGENVAQAAQFVESGAADVGVIARSLSQSPAMRGKGRSWPIPDTAHPPIRQGGVILSWARDREATRLFRDFATSEEGRAVFRRHGFTAAGGER